MEDNKSKVNEVSSMLGEKNSDKNKKVQIGVVIILVVCILLCLWLIIYEKQQVTIIVDPIGNDEESEEVKVSGGDGSIYVEDKPKFKELVSEINRDINLGEEIIPPQSIEYIAVNENGEQKYDAAIEWEQKEYEINIITEAVEAGQIIQTLTINGILEECDFAIGVRGVPVEGTINIIMPEMELCDVIINKRPWWKFFVPKFTMSGQVKVNPLEIDDVRIEIYQNGEMICNVDEISSIGRFSNIKVNKKAYDRKSKSFTDVETLLIHDEYGVLLEKALTIELSR